MNTINSMGSDTNLLNQLSMDETSARKKNNNLDQSAFLKLMTAQMNYQNPLEPQSNTEFLSQMAQFGTVNGISDLNKSISTMAQAMQGNQTLAATNLIGKSVTYQANNFVYSGETEIKGSIDLDQNASHLNLSVYNEAGEVIKKMPFPDQSAGAVNFTWDGKNQDGETMPSGVYYLKAEGLSEGKSHAFSTNLSDHIDSVTIDKKNQTIYLNLAKKGSVSIDSVNRIA